MENEKAIQEDLDRAQADLEVKVGQLKTAVMDKLETPKRIISKVEHAVATLRAHPALIIGAVVGTMAGALLLLHLFQRHAMRHAR
jgi:hypothetical protein